MPGKPGVPSPDIGLIGSSERMRQVFDVIDKVADTPSTVLITGESGTGKDLIAKEIHRKSRWAAIRGLVSGAERNGMRNRRLSRS